mgnify:CR=1 FL=1
MTLKYLLDKQYNTDISELTRIFGGEAREENRVTGEVDFLDDIALIESMIIHIFALMQCVLIRPQICGDWLWLGAY